MSQGGKDSPEKMWRANAGLRMTAAMRLPLRVRTNAAPPERQFERVNEGDPQSFTEITSEINQPHVFNSTLGFIFGDETPFGSGFWHGLIRNSTLSIVARAASGLPYTPATPDNTLLGFGADDVRRELNSEQQPATFIMNLLLQKK